MTRERLSAIRAVSTDPNNDSITLPIDPSIPEEVQTVATLNHLIRVFSSDPKVIEFTRKLLTTRRNNDHKRNFEDIAKFITDSFIYVADPMYVEYVISPTVMLKDWATSGKMHGDCDDVCLLMASMLVSVGIDTRIVAVKAGSDYFNHVILETSLGSKSIQYDPCLTYSIVRYDEMLVA